MNEHLTAFPSLSEKKPQKYGRKQKTPPSPEEKRENFPGECPSGKRRTERRTAPGKPSRRRTILRCGVPGACPKRTRNKPSRGLQPGLLNEARYFTSSAVASKTASPPPSNVEMLSSTRLRTHPAARSDAFAREKTFRTVMLYISSAVGWRPP